MACHELAALRLGLMRILGRDDEAEKQHEVAELGDSAERDGPIRSLMEARDLAELARFFDAAVVELEDRVAGTDAGDPQLPYLKTLLVLTRKVEMELEGRVAAVVRLFEELEEVHDFVHELYPAR